MADEEIGWKAKARAWVEESDSDSDNDEASRKPHRGAHVSAANGSYVYRRFMYISDSYLSQAKYQTYALMFLAVVITVGGGVGYSFSEEGVTLEDGIASLHLVRRRHYRAIGLSAPSPSPTDRPLYPRLRRGLCAGVLSSGTNAPIEIVPRVVANTLVVMNPLLLHDLVVVKLCRPRCRLCARASPWWWAQSHRYGMDRKSLLFVKEIINAVSPGVASSGCCARKARSRWRRS